MAGPSPARSLVLHMEVNRESSPHAHGRDARATVRARATVAHPSPPGSGPGRGNSVAAGEHHFTFTAGDAPFAHGSESRATPGATPLSEPAREDATPSPKPGVNPARRACLRASRRRYYHPVNRQDPAHPAARPDRHQADAGRSARLSVSGLTLALLLTTALAGIAATADLSDRLGERSTRLATTRVEIAATILFGHGLVALPAIATLEIPSFGDSAADAAPGSRPDSWRAQQRRSMVRAGLIALPPPAGM